LKLQGQKEVGTETWQDEIAFNTGVLGKPDVGRLRTPVPGPDDGPRLSRDEMKYTDLDKVWGGDYGCGWPVPSQRYDDTPYMRRLYIADLPT